MEWLWTACDLSAGANVAAWLGHVSLTDIVFIFLCSKPVFVLAALLVGLRAHFGNEDEPTKQLPPEH